METTTRHQQLPNTRYVGSKLLRVTYRPFITWLLLTRPVSPPNTPSVSPPTILRFTASHQNLERALWVPSSPHATLPSPSPSGMTLLVLHGSTQQEPLQGYFPHLLRQNYSSSMCPQHHPARQPNRLHCWRRKHCSARRL